MVKGPAKFVIEQTDGSARAAILTLYHGEVHTPVYMPVGTQGTLKGFTTQQILDTGCEIMLSNTYFLNLRPGINILQQQGGLHKMMNYSKNILTDSGGFQMVSLLDLTEMTEEGVWFTSPIDSQRLLLTPELSIQTQQAIGSDIMMVLDDVISAELDPLKDKQRIIDSAARTTRWLDRCINAHSSAKQTLFAICQGHLDFSENGSRQYCINDLIQRRDELGGIAIGGLSGGEAKADFWQVVKFCCVNLPQDLPRYLMGVGYPVDILTCTLLGVDMFDCVYATRTARFGVAFTNDGELKLQHLQCVSDLGVIQDGCGCETCKTGISRHYLNMLFKEDSAVAGQLTSIHNVYFLLNMMRNMRQAILEKRSGGFVCQFLKKWYGSKEIEQWVVDALNSVGIAF